MSLALKFDNITDWKIDGSFFRIGTFSHVLSGEPGCYVRSESRCFTPNAQSGGGLILDFGGPVWLDAWVYTDIGGWERGGYLEPVTTEWNFYGEGGGTITQDLLGVRPAPYTGGVKIEGTHTPPNQWTDISGAFGTDTGTMLLSEGEPFVWDNTRMNFLNWKASRVGWTSASMRMSTTLSCVAAYEIRWGWDH